MFSNLIKSNTGNQGDFWFEQTYGPVSAGPPVPPGYQLSKGDFPTTTGVIPAMQIMDSNQLGNLAFATDLYGTGPSTEYMLPPPPPLAAYQTLMNKTSGMTVDVETQTDLISDMQNESILKCHVGTQVNIDRHMSSVNISCGSSSSVDSYNEKQALGEKLFPLVEKMIIEENIKDDSESCIHLSASKITGMLLEIDVAELLHYLKYHVLLKIKFHQAVAVLKEYAIKEKFMPKQKKNAELSESESQIYPINLYPLVETLCLKKLEELDGSVFQLPKEYCPGFSLMIFQMIMKRSKNELSLMLDSSEFLKACVDHAVADRQYQAIRPIVHKITTSTRDVFQQLLESENGTQLIKEEHKVTESQSGSKTYPSSDSEQQTLEVKSLRQEIENLKLRHECEVENLTYQLENKDKTLFKVTEDEQQMNRDRIMRLEKELKNLKGGKFLCIGSQDNRKLSETDRKPVQFGWSKKKEVIPLSTDWFDPDTGDTSSKKETNESEEQTNENASESNDSNVGSPMASTGSPSNRTHPTKTKPEKIIKTPNSKKKAKQKKRAR